MGGPRVGIIGAGGVGVATASSIIMRGLAGRVTIYTRKPDVARGLALDFLHARPLLPSIEIRGLGVDQIEEEDILVLAAGHHTTAGETRLDIFHKNLEVMEEMATAIEATAMPRIALVVTNPLDVLTEYLARRWADRPVAVMGSGTSLDTLRLTQRIAQECQVHTRSVHAWVVGEHGDSSVFLLGSATVGTLPLLEFAAQRGVDLTPRGSIRSSTTFAAPPTRSATSRAPRCRASGSPSAGSCTRPRTRSERSSRCRCASATTCAPACRACSAPTARARRSCR